MSGQRLSRFLSILLTVLLPVLAAAQGENNHWVFGNQNGLDFNFIPPVPFPTNLQTAEGSAAVSNAAGQLLFYSNGNKVYNANNAVMPNGNGMLGNFTNAGFGSACQGVLIMPAVGSSNLYYLFTLDPLENYAPPAYPNYLRYSVIDMSLNGGLGDVVAGQKNIIIDSTLGEKMTSVRGAGCYNWLVVHEINTNKFHSFKVNTAGISAAPVISVTGVPVSPFSTAAHAYYELKTSPNDSLIVNTSVMGAELHDFDRTTGILSNARSVVGDVGAFSYGAAFSPDAKKLYLARSSIFKGLAQYDLSLLPNMTAVNNSRLLVDTNYLSEDIRLAPNGKIYIITSNTGGMISVVNNPNLTGSACGFVANANLMLPNGPGVTFGTDVVVAPPDTFTHVTHDTMICFGPPVTVTAPTGYTSYTWSDGRHTLTDTFSAPGIKWVAGTAGCTMRIDTFRISSLSDTTFFSKDTIACLVSATLTLSAPTGYISRIWQDGSTLLSNTITTPGNKWVISRNGCHYRIDTFKVQARPFDTTFHSRDTSVCFPATFTLHAPANYASYSWSNGVVLPNASFSAPGAQWVLSQNGCSLRMDTILVKTGHIDTTFVTFDTTLCFAPLISVMAKSGYADYVWSDGSHGQSHTFNAPATVQVYMQNGCFARMETYHAGLTDFDIPLIADTFLCKGDSILLNAFVTGAQYTWQNAGTNPVLSVKSPGTFTVIVSIGNCSKTASVTITGKKLELDLGGNRKPCDGEEITLNAATNGVQYQWQDNSTAPSITVKANGKYWVTISQASCAASDTVLVEYHNCSCVVTLPDAFTPNNDGHNDTYKPLIYGEPSGYEFRVYNRWGQCVFTSYNPAAGWDGNFNGKACDLGTYFYQLKMHCFKGQEEHRSGEVMLIR